MPTLNHKEAQQAFLGLSTFRRNVSGGRGTKWKSTGRNVSTAGCIYLCVSTTGTEGASGSLHFIKSLHSLLVFSRLRWPVSFNEHDVNVIQQGNRDAAPSEDDGIGRKLQRNIPRRQTQTSYWWGKKQTLKMRGGCDVSEAGLVVTLTLTETVLDRQGAVI